MIQAPSDRQEIRTWPRAYLKGVVTFRSGYRNTDTAVPDGKFPFFVCSSEVLRSNEFDFDDEAVVMAGNNADGVFHLHHFNGKFAARQRTYVITPNAKRLDCRYLFYQLGVLQRSFQAAAIGTTTRYVTIGMLRGAEIPLPELAIQRAIAEALSDADALIESLEQLLAKKRQLKQGAMQELLTGKKRLPGFSGDWEVKPLGRMLTICHGKSQREIEATDGMYPILATGGEIGRTNRFLYDKPSVLIGRKGTIDEPQYMDTPFWTVDTLFYSVVHEPNCAKFLFYRFCLIDWKQHNEASGVPSLNARTIETIEINSPGPEEQGAIAAILSDMDVEIAALEEKLAKARNIKQGMMQELLTGRIRLV